LTLGGWCSGCTARASCLFISFVGRHFFERGGLVVVLDFRTQFLMNANGGGREAERTKVLGSH
jgi:hypothetical protein